MKRKETYLSRDFRETVALRFPAQAKELNTAFDMRLSALLAENADASKEKQYHLKRQILPGIAAYETLQRVMPKEEALQIVHGYVERLARTSHKQLAALIGKSDRGDRTLLLIVWHFRFSQILFRMLLIFSQRS